MSSPGWMEQAACRGVDPVLFFGPEIETPLERDQRVPQAKAVCARCPVRLSCLEWALSRPSQVGVAGEKTAQERAAERRRRRDRWAS